MKKYLIMFAFLSLGVIGMAGKSYASDTMTRNEIVLSSAIINTTSSRLIFTGPGAVYGLVLSTGAATNFICLRDSATANTSSAELLPRTAFQALIPQSIIFAQPIRVYNGLSANMFSAAVNEGAGILYKTGKLP